MKSSCGELMTDNARRMSDDELDVEKKESRTWREILEEQRRRHESEKEVLQNRIEHLDKCRAYLTRCEESTHLKNVELNKENAVLKQVNIEQTIEHKWLIDKFLDMLNDKENHMHVASTKKNSEGYALMAESDSRSTWARTLQTMHEKMKDEQEKREISESNWMGLCEKMMQETCDLRAENARLREKLAELSNFVTPSKRRRVSSSLRMYCASPSPMNAKYTEADVLVSIPGSP